MLDRPRLPLLLIALLLSIGQSAAALAREIGPDDPFCRAINDPASGDEIVLRPGEYRGPCMIRRGGGADRPLVVRAKDPANRPHIDFNGADANVLEIHADHVVVAGLSFGPTRNNVDGIRIRASRGVSVIGCEFTGMGGIAVVANQSSLRGLVVSGNQVSHSGATAMYFGCHDGEACRLSEVVIEKNRIAGVDASEKAVGYGIQVKLNSAALIRDNLITDTKGPGIMVYGSKDSSVESVIERNFVSGSRTSGGIIIGGGPAIVRNNIAVANSAGGIGMEDYGRRGLLRGVKIGFNSTYGNEAGGITAPESGKLHDSVLAGNAGWGDRKAAVFPQPQPGLMQVDNLVCARSCFSDPNSSDFSPAPGSPLSRAVTRFHEAWVPEDDFFGHRRGEPSRIGAVETGGSAMDRRF